MDVLCRNVKRHATLGFVVKTVQKMLTMYQFNLYNKYIFRNQNDSADGNMTLEI